MVMENPLDLFFAVFGMFVAMLIFFGFVDKLPTQVIDIIVALMFISAFFDIIA